MAVMALEDLASALPATAPLIGIDLGTRNIGIAVSDRLRTVRPPARCCAGPASRRMPAP